MGSYLAQFSASNIRDNVKLSPVFTVSNQYVALQHSFSPLCLVASEVLPKKQLYSTNERRENDNEALFKVDGSSVAYTHH
jgi:hypothetical protein